DPARGWRPGGAAARVHPGRDLAPDLLAVVVEERHRPYAIAGAVRHAAHRVDPRLGVAEQPARVLAQRDDDGAGERRDVDEVRRAEPPRVPEAVAQNEPAFGVGLDDLDGLPRCALPDVARFDRPAAR